MGWCARARQALARVEGRESRQRDKRWRTGGKGTASVGERWRMGVFVVASERVVVVRIGERGIGESRLFGPALDEAMGNAICGVPSLDVEARSWESSRSNTAITSDAMRAVSDESKVCVGVCDIKTPDVTRHRQEY